MIMRHKPLSHSDLCFSVKHKHVYGNESWDRHNSFNSVVVVVGCVRGGGAYDEILHLLAAVG